MIGRIANIRQITECNRNIIHGIFYMQAIKMRFFFFEPTIYKENNIKRNEPIIHKNKIIIDALKEDD